MSRCTAVLIASAPLAGLLGIAVVLDLAVAATLSWISVCTMAALGLVSVAVLWAITRRVESLSPFIPFCLTLIVLTSLDTSPLKPFARFYASVRPGMTEAEVLRALDDKFPRSGRYLRPAVNRQVGPNNLGFILDPRDRRYDAEIVSVDFRDGRVVNKEYLPD